MAVPFEFEAAAQELARHSIGWHECGSLVERPMRCRRCGAVAPETVLLLTDPRIRSIYQNLVSAHVASEARRRVKAAMESAVGSLGPALDWPEPPESSSLE